MFDVLSAVASLAATTAAPSGLTPQQALTTSLTAESLLFAAFGVSYSLATTPRAGGRPVFFARGWFGGIIVAVLFVVAASGVSAWHATFARDWPNDGGEYIRTWGLFVAIVSQPFLAAAINWQARG
jgi:hypothetical protein